MKKMLWVALISFIASGVQAQKPEKIVSFAKVPKTYAYYKQQAELWQKELRKDKKNNDAWYNYYFAERYAFYHSEKQDYLLRKKFTDSLLGQMQKYIPNSFEYNYILYRESGLDLKYLPNLEKAYAMAPERTETYSDLVVCYEASRKIPERNKFLKLMYEKTGSSPGLLNYSYNVLNGLEPNTILITIGDNDTYPVWMLQVVKGIRPDVKMLNHSMLYIDDYRNKIFAEIGADTTGLKVGLTAQEQREFESELIKRLAANTKKYPVALSLTACADNLQGSLKEKLYLTGLAMKYSDERFDNIAVLKKNFEQNYALDYLKISFVQNDAWGEVVKQINRNYIIPLVKLYEHYKLSGEINKANEYKELAIIAGKGTEQEEELKKYFSEN